MTAIRMGLTTVRKESQNIALTGDQEIAKSMQTWLGLSPFAGEQKRVGHSSDCSFGAEQSRR